MLTIKLPLKTIEKICALLEQREIKVEMMQLSMQGEVGKLFIHCEIEKDKIPYIVRNLENLHCVQTTDWMISKRRDKLYQEDKNNEMNGTDHADPC
jgi:hypothetical protein